MDYGEWVNKNCKSRCEELDEWLMNNPKYSQDERELIIKALIAYENREEK